MVSINDTKIQFPVQTKLNCERVTASPDYCDPKQSIRGGVVSVEARRGWPIALPKGHQQSRTRFSGPQGNLPTTDGRKVILGRYTQPEKDQQLLLNQLKLQLPQQPPPRITASRELAS